MTVPTASPAIDAFITRWSKSSGKERANFQPFAEHLCDILGVEKPAGSVEAAHQNFYAYERDVHFKNPDGTTSPGRIDLYKRGCFVLEAKQSRQKGGKKELMLAGQGDLLIPDSRPQGQRSANRAWDVLMMNAKRQAEDYAKALPPSDGWPPFILICDVGHCIEVYADSRGRAKTTLNSLIATAIAFISKTCATIKYAIACAPSGRRPRLSIRPANRPKSRVTLPHGWPKFRRRWSSGKTSRTLRMSRTF